MNFNAIDNNGLVDGFCIIKNVERKTSSKGDTYLDLTLSDKSGEINAKLWRYNPSEHGEYGSGDTVKVRGTLSQYNGQDQLRIERIRPIIESDGIKTEDLVQCAAFTGEEMYNELIRIAEGFTDLNLKKIVLAIYEDNKESLLFWPAASKLHHAVRGGLLMHTLSIVRLCEGFCAVYPFIDRELLISGAMLHDIGKIEEFTLNSAGAVEEYSLKGNLLGHLTMGARTVNEYAKRLDINSETATLLEHMILSHHGQPEFGAAVKPMFIEADVLSYLDLMDARLYEMKEAELGAKKGEFTGKVWAIDNLKLYNHQRTDLNKDPKLL